MTQDVYIGPYLRVWMPKEKSMAFPSRCKHCKEPVQYKANFCPHCGLPIAYEEVEYLPSFGNYCEEKFGDPDLFRGMRIAGLDYILVGGNSEQEYAIFTAHDDIGEYDLPPRDFSGTWEDLKNALTADGITFEERYGAVVYYS